MAENQSLSFEQYLGELIRRECEERRVNRIARLLRQSKIPPEKTFEAFKMPRLPRKVSRQVKTLLAGDFLDRAENVLVFGRSGTGKTHLLCGLGQELIRQGRRVHFTTCSLLVQELLIAKRDLKLSRAIRRFAKCDALIIDDIGYVQQSREEMEVLFTLLGRTLRTRQRAADEQSCVLEMGTDIQGPDDHGGRDRPSRSPQRDPGNERGKLPAGRSKGSNQNREVRREAACGEANKASNLSRVPSRQ